MKKVLFMIAMLAAGLSAGAQGKWHKVEQAADELTGAKGGMSYWYTVEGVGHMTVWNWDDAQFCLVSDGVPFATEVVGRFIGMQVLVGLYDDNGEMDGKFEMWLDKERGYAGTVIRTRDAGTMSNPVGQKKKVNRIFERLRSGKGYVRIVAGRFNGDVFDIKIHPLDI